MGRGITGTTPPRHLSRNLLVNSTKVFSREMGSLCIRCGELGHRKPECQGIFLELWEQAKLKEILWPRVNSKFSGTGPGLRYRDIDNSY